jgi:hypothetical protein
VGRKKKDRSPESMLARAEKLFRRGNYSLAKKEFEKVLQGRFSPRRRVVPLRAGGQPASLPGLSKGLSGPEPERMVERKDISERVEICNREIKRLKAEDLIKRARKYSADNNPREALRCFEEAYGITGEDWIQEKIGRLREISLIDDLRKSARDAEVTGEYLKAAELYEQAFMAQERKDLIVRKAVCLVKAEKYSEAVSLLQDLALTDLRAMYYYGFALAKVGRYFECLKVWDGIDSQDNCFLAQKRAAGSLLAAKLHDRFTRAEDFASIYQEGNYLLNSTGAQGLTGVVEYCKYAWIEELWKEERYETIADLLEHSPAEMEPALLSLHAKTLFKLAEKSEASLDGFTMFWLTALFSAKSESFSTEEVEGDKVRRELIRMGEDLIKSKVKSGDKSTEGALIFWDLERRLAEDLHGLIGDQEDFADLVCTPRFASRFGKSAQILRVIRDKRHLFRNLEHYLETGSYYSTAWQSLYYLEGKDYENALASLPETEEGDEFADYGGKKVTFSCGLHQLGKGEDPPKLYGETATALFDMAPRYEKQFIENALNADELDQMRCYEQVLHDIHRKRPLKQIKEALSLVMSSCAVELYNQERIIPRSLEIALTEALGLNPENELARGSLNDLRVLFKVQELEQAISKNKMNKACKMAVETEYQEVRDHFFEFLEDAIESMDEMQLGYEDKIALLRNIQKWCIRVDDAHPILYDIKDMLAHLEQR